MSVPVVLSRIKKVFKFFEQHHATSPENAVPFADVPFSNKWYVERLIDKDVIKRFGEKVYLDLENKNAYLKRKRLMAMGIVFLSLMIIYILFYHK
jgi:hypothetical protein